MTPLGLAGVHRIVIAARVRGQFQGRFPWGMPFSEATTAAPGEAPNGPGHEDLGPLVGAR